MPQTHVVTGVLANERTVALDQALPVNSGRVRLIVEVLSEATGLSYGEVMAQLRERQQQRGHVPPTRAEVDAYLQEERASWDD